MCFCSFYAIKACVVAFVFVTQLLLMNINIIPALSLLGIDFKHGDRFKPVWIPSFML
jgi:hypothetical protein